MLSKNQSEVSIAICKRSVSDVGEVGCDVDEIMRLD